MHVTDALEDYLFQCSTLSPQTLRWYSQKLRRLVAWLHDNHIDDVQGMTPKVLQQFVVSLGDVSTYTSHGYAQVIKSFAHYLVKEDEYSERSFHRLQMPRVTKKVIEVFTPAQIQALLEASKHERFDDLVFRDRAIVAVLIDTGIRANELCTLTLDNVTAKHDGGVIKVLGKGRKERVVPLGRQSRHELHKYLSRHRPHSEFQHVFLTRDRKPMQVHTLELLFVRLEKHGHITGVRCSPHTCRHTFAFNYMLQGGDIFKLSLLLGHASVTTTANTYLAAFKSQDILHERRSVLDSLGKS